MQILTASDHQTEVGNPYGGIRGRIQGPKEDGFPLGKQVVSSNPNPWDLLETVPQSESIHRLVQGPWNI